MTISLENPPWETTFYHYWRNVVKSEASAVREVSDIMPTLLSIASCEVSGGISFWDLKNAKLFNDSASAVLRKSKFCWSRLSPAVLFLCMAACLPDSYHFLQAWLGCWCCAPLAVHWKSFHWPQKDDRLSQPHLVWIQPPKELKLRNLRYKASHTNH